MTSQSAAKVWFITGGSSGIGLKPARQALAAGESVATVALKTSAIDELDRSD